MGKAAYPPRSCAIVKKSGNLNFPEPSGPVQAYIEDAFPLHIQKWNTNRHYGKRDYPVSSIKFVETCEMHVTTDLAKVKAFIHDMSFLSYRIQS